VNDPEYDPDAGTVGYLTFDQFDRLRRADENARKYVPWLRVAGYLRSGTDPDEFRSRSAMSHPPLGLPATWLAAEEISRLSYELNGWPTLEDACRDDWGAVVAEQYTREVETAAAKWPISDRSRAVRFIRCYVCQQLTLRYFPPTFAGERLIDSTVKCTEKSCRAVVGEVDFARMALLVEQEWELRNGKRRVDSDSGSAGEGQQIEVDGVPVAVGGADSDDTPDEGPVAVSAGSFAG
jgi:hypothetical protein